MKLLAARRTPAFKRTEAAVLGLYLALTGWVAIYHEPWTDEAQAWLLARDNSLCALLFRRLHYEGTPGLWHALLWLFCRLHFSYAAMHAATVFIGVAAAFLLLRRSPFPALVRWLLPFSVALAYQTPVIARSYSLTPLLGFAICVALGAKKERPLLVALLAGLLANTSLIAVFLAFGLAIFGFFAQRTELPPQKKNRLAAVALFAVFGLFALYTALPAPDTNEGQAQALAANPRVAAVLAQLTGSSARCTAQPAANCVTGNAPRCQPATGNATYRHHAHRGGALAALAHIAALAFFPVSNLNLLALAFYAALIYWQWKHKALICSLPLLATLIGAKVLPFSEHHTSVLWAAIIVTLWLTWQRIDSQEKIKFDSVFAVVLLAVLVQQIAWTAFAATYDLHHPFDGSVEAAQYLETNAGGRAIAGFNYHSIGLAAFAPRNLYFNQSTAYWPWSCAADSDARIAVALSQHPQFVVAGESYDGDVSWRNQILKEKPAWTRNDEDGIAAMLETHGYRPTHRFCGNQPAQFGFSEQSCEVIYEPQTTDQKQ
jgi:hypothetical protein